MFPEALFLFCTLIYFCIIEYVIIHNKIKINGNYYNDPKEVTYFNTTIDVKMFIYIVVIIVNNMTNLMYLTCGIRFLVALIDYLKYSVDGTIEMSRDAAHSLYCLIWLVIYFYTTNNISFPHLMTILGSIIGINVINKRIDS